MLNIIMFIIFAIVLIGLSYFIPKLLLYIDRMQFELVYYKSKYKEEKNKHGLKFSYKNWKGKISDREIYPIFIYYGNTEYHKGNQWLLEAFDIDKNAKRIFALKDILEWRD